MKASLMRASTQQVVRVAAVASLAILAIACGGSEKSDDAGTANTATDTVADSTPDDTVVGGDFTAGDVQYRAVNLLNEPVDLYVRTQGLVEAFLVEAGLAPGEVSDFHAPPVDGTFLVVEAGADDATCVATCPHFIANLTAFPTDGPNHTVVLHGGGDQRGSFDLWESADGGSGNANEMAAADPATGLVVVTAIALTDADFGLQLGIEGVAGCQLPTNLSNVLVGGNQTPAFAYSGNEASILLYENQDRECTGEPVGGPFTVAGGAGTRNHLILHGSPGAMQAVILPMIDEGTAGGDRSDEERRAEAIVFVSDSLTAEAGIPSDQATCAAGYVVDALGLDVIFNGDDLVDFDGLPTAAQDIASNALALAVTPCGIDPALLGL